MKIARSNPENAWSHCPVCGHKKSTSYNRNRDEDATYCDCKPKAGDQIDYDAIVDWRGNEARIGDLVAYPYLSGRSAQISTGIITRIYAACPKSYGSDFQTRLQVVPLDRSYWNLYSSNRDTPIEERKPTTLQYWDRFILLEEREVR